MFSGILILVIFLVAAALMYTRRLPALLALPLMALAIALVAGTSQPGWTVASLRALLFDKVLVEGARKLAGTMVTTMFGAMLSQVVMRQGIAPQMIRWAAEYAGDRKLVLAIVLYFVVALNFAVVAGLGPVIMLGSLVLPILVSSGFTPLYASTVMLLGIAIGGVFYAGNWQFYVDLVGLDKAIVRFYAQQVALILGSVSLFYLIFEGRRQSKVFAWAAPSVGYEDEGPKVPALAYLTPVLPLVLMLGFNWPDIPAFMLAIFYGCVTTQPRRLVSSITAAVLEGLKDIGPVLGLFLGLGMCLTAMQDESAKGIMLPFLKAVVPTTPLGFVAFFACLAPLTLYRGPLNMFGLGAGFAALLAKLGLLPARAVMTAFMSVGQMQSVCDPTNTHNVWIAQFVHESPDRIMKHTVPYIWGFVLLALGYLVWVQKVMG